jgi:ankyrin repeat protein
MSFVNNQHPNSINFNSVNSINETPLFTYYKYKHVKYLLENGSNPNHKSFGQTYLHNYPYSDYDLKHNEAIIELFYKHGADFNTKNDDGDTVMHVCEDINIRKLFANRGASLDIENNEGVTVRNILMGRKRKNNYKFVNPRKIRQYIVK